MDARFQDPGVDDEDFDLDDDLPAAPVDGEGSWAITDHVCRVCFSRILSAKAKPGLRVYRCSGCGLQGTGRLPSCVCACGIKLPRSTKDAGIRCVKNDQVTPEAPFEVVARQVLT